MSEPPRTELTKEILLILHDAADRDTGMDRETLHGYLEWHWDDDAVRAELQRLKRRGEIESAGKRGWYRLP